GTLSGVASIMDASPTDLSAIDPQALTGLAGSTSAPILDIERPQHQNFMAKDSQPELNYFSEQGPVTNPLTSIDGNEAALPQPEPILEIAQSEHEEVQDEPVEPAIELVDPESLIPTTTEKGIFRIPDSDEHWDEWLAAAEALPVEGFFIGQGMESTTVVIIRSQAVMLGEISKIEKNGKTYSFRVDKVDDGVVRLSAVGSS
ncbi:MAG: hypothetical protein AAGC73_05815, partial [Verrucomicrobiota bacterium]